MPAEHKPTADQRSMVESLSGFGIPQEHIAGKIDIDLKTLRKHYRKELDGGVTKANSQVAQSLYKKAVELGDTTAMIFWLKTRARWSETQKVELSNPDGTLKPVDLSNLTDDQLKQLRNISNIIEPKSD